MIEAVGDNGLARLARLEKLEELHQLIDEVDWKKVSLALATTSKGPEDAHAWARQVSIAGRIIRLQESLK